MQDIAVARDISPGGMLIETATAINTMDIRILASTGDDERIEAAGIVIYSMQTAEQKFRTGIGFQGSSQQLKQFVASIMLAAGADR